MLHRWSYLVEVNPLIAGDGAGVRVELGVVYPVRTPLSVEVCVRLEELGHSLVLERRRTSEDVVSSEAVRRTCVGKRGVNGLIESARKRYGENNIYLRLYDR